MDTAIPEAQGAPAQGAQAQDAQAQGAPIAGKPVSTTLSEIPPDWRRQHTVQEKYMTAVAELTGAVVVAIPSFGADGPPPAEICDRLDGLLFTGSIANVHPSQYGEPPSAAAEPYDRQRDGTTLPLLNHAIEQGLPTLCICRGFQELNVVCGGTLYPRIHEIPGRQDHRKPASDDLDIQYGPKHSLRLIPGGWLDGLVAQAQLNQAQLKTPLQVNSLHYQAVKDLGHGLAVEATAEDGTVEAMRLMQTPSGGDAGYCAAVQWHPEYRAATNPLSRVLFEDFAAQL